MPYCYNCGKEIKETSKYCPECGFESTKKSVKVKEKEESQKQTTERIIIKEKHHSGGVVSAVLIILFIIAGIIFVVYLANEGAFSGGGGISKIVDPCERAFDTCNRECGEGWGSGLCKTGCTYDYNKCKENR